MSLSLVNIIIYAHSVADELPKHGESLAEHLAEVARRAMDMAAGFGCGELTFKTAGQFGFDPL